MAYEVRKDNMLVLKGWLTLIGQQRQLHEIRCPSVLAAACLSRLTKVDICI
jgi:hypothetical protein